LAVLTVVQVAVGAILVSSAAKEILRARLPGKLLLAASTMVFFWFEAMEATFDDPPFSVPEEFLSLWGQFPLELLRQAFVYIALFYFMLCVGFSVSLEWMRPSFLWVSRRVDVASSNRKLLRYALASCAFIPLLSSYAFDLDTTVEALIAGRSKAAPAAQDSGLAHYLSFLGMYGASLLLVEGVLDRSLRRAWPLAVGFIAALPFIMGGARHLWLFVALPACVLALCRIRGKINLTLATHWALGLLLVLMVFQLQFVLRARGWESIASVRASDLLPEEMTGQFVALLFAQHLVPSLHDYFREPAEPYFLTHWIPRQFWPDKPIMRSWQFYNAAYTRGGNYNVTPSVIGQFHLNWGTAGVIFIGLWLGILTKLADHLLLAVDLSRQKAMAVAVGMFYAFIVASFRFYSPVYFTYFVFAVMGMLLLTRSHRYFKPSRSEVSRLAKIPAFRAREYE
jgi:hypothetical protein